MARDSGAEQSEFALASNFADWVWRFGAEGEIDFFIWEGNFMSEFSYHQLQSL